MRLLPAILVFSALTAFAQDASYRPKTITLEGVPAADVPRLLEVAHLQPNQPTTKEQIEAALQHLGDTGLFTDLSYQVSGDTLTITLTASAQGQTLPVRFANLVWWKPADLEALLEKRVPLYHGSLPLNGNLTDQVIDATVALLKEKGVDAKVTANPSTKDATHEVDTIALTVTQPAIVLGNIGILGAPDEAGVETARLQAILGGQDFDERATPVIIVHSVTEHFHNAGFLTAKPGDPIFAVPRRDTTSSSTWPRIFIDVTVPLNDAELYHLKDVEIEAAAPLTEKQLLDVLKLKAGDPARAFDRSVAEGALRDRYHEAGYLDATSVTQLIQDTAAHTVKYDFRMVAGTQYRAGIVDTSALDPEQRKAFAAVWREESGQMLDEDFEKRLAKAIATLKSPRTITVRLLADRRSKIATFTLIYGATATNR